MIVNYYIEVPGTDSDLLDKMLASQGFAFYDATAFDSYTSGPCALYTLEEIEADIELK